VGPHCSFCGTFTGPFSQVEGLFTGPYLYPCLEVRRVRQTPCSASTTPASPGTSGAVRSRAAIAGSSAPGIWSGIPRPSTRTGRPPTSCCGPIRTSASGSCTAAAIGHRRADPTGLWWPSPRSLTLEPRAAQVSHDRGGEAAPCADAGPGWPCRCSSSAWSSPSSSRSLMAASNRSLPASWRCWWASARSWSSGP
jgi:hypothetical protein